MAMYERFGKRSLDLIAASALLLCLLPVLVLVGLSILVLDGAPVFFRQERVGRHGLPFQILKFRTMTQMRHDSSTFAAGDQSRITRIGATLRDTKVDELPQLINVLCGDMSLVGPRPEVAVWVEEFRARWETALTIRPGITDNAALLYRHEERELAAVVDPVAHYRQTVLPRKLDLYEDYARDISLRKDVRILWRTFLRLFT